MHTSRVGCDDFMKRQNIFYETCMHTSRVGCDVGGPAGDVGLTGRVCTHPVWDVTNAKKITDWGRITCMHTSRVGCDEQGEV